MRLAVADFRVGFTDGVRAVSTKETVIKGLELWTPNDARQKVLWPTTVQFSADYFESLMVHDVPLNEQAIKRLAESSMGLDVYTWLTERLHRIDPRKTAMRKCCKQARGGRSAYLGGVNELDAFQAEG